MEKLPLFEGFDYPVHVRQWQSHDHLRRIKDKHPGKYGTGELPEVPSITGPIPFGNPNRLTADDLISKGFINYGPGEPTRRIKQYHNYRHGDWGWLIIGIWPYDDEIKGISVEIENGPTWSQIGTIYSKRDWNKMIELYELPNSLKF